MANVGISGKSCGLKWLCDALEEAEVLSDKRELAREYSWHFVHGG